MLSGLLCAGLPCCAVLCPVVRWSRRVIPNRKDLCENVTTQDAQNIPKSYNLDGILSQFYGLGRFGMTLAPFWELENASGHSKAPFSRILAPKGTPSGVQKSPLKLQGHHLSLQSVSWKRVFLDLRLHPNLPPQKTAKI